MCHNMRLHRQIRVRTGYAALCSGEKMQLHEQLNLAVRGRRHGGELDSRVGMAEREIPARELGESVMQELKVMDKVAYIRFASVYRSFSDVDDFNEAIRNL